MNLSNSQFFIQHVSTSIDAINAKIAGFCSVECSFGEESVVDALAMDHHGALSHLESVALRAWREHRGARRDDPRFVVTGAADADATFAIAALAGLLPEGRDCGALAELIAAADMHPLALADDPRPEAALLLLWRRMASGVQDATAFYAGVDRWRALLKANPPSALLDAARAEETARLALARTARVERLSPQVAFVESPVPAFDVWYAEIAPVIVAYVAEARRVTIGVRDLPTAQQLFGPRGLLEVLPKLQPPGWGGRETIGGSPRGQRFSQREAISVAEQIVAEVTAA